MSASVQWRTSFGWLVCQSTSGVELPDDLLGDVLRTCLASGASRWAVGYDHRSGADAWAARLADELARRGRDVLLAAQPCPLAATALQLEQGRAKAGLVVTALSEPVGYAGVVLLPYSRDAAAQQDGRSAELPDERTEVTAGRVQKSDFRGELLDFYRRNLSARLLRSAQLQVLIDAGGGVGDRLLEEVLRGTVARVATIYGLPLSTFYNRPVLPGPSDLFELSLQVERGKWHVGLSLSGGADSLTVLDENGRCLDPGDLQMLLLESELQDASQAPLLLSEGVTWRAENLVRERGAATTRVKNGVWGVSAALVTGTGDERIGLGELGQVLTPDLPVPDATFAALRFLKGLARRRVPLSEWVEEVQRRYGRSALRWRQVTANVAGGRNLAGVAELNVPGLGQLARVRSSGGEDGPMEGKWSADGGHTWVWALGGAGRFLLVAEASDPEGAQALLDRVESLLH